MNDTSVSPADASPARQANTSRLVHDLATRLMHGLLAVCFIGAYLTSDSEHWRYVHTTLGYTALGLVLTRLLWGVAGPRHVRLSAWLKRLQAAWANWHSGRMQTHNLLHALTVLALLAVVLLTTMTGVVNDQSWADDWAEELHETLGNLMLLMVIGHVGLLLLGSWLRKRNLFMPMLTGRTPGPGPDPVKHPHRLLATVLLLATLVFWGWRYMQAPAPEADRAAASQTADSASELGDDDDEHRGGNRRHRSDDDDDD